jgi:hypothetical protein
MVPVPSAWSPPPRDPYLIAPKIHSAVLTSDPQEDLQLHALFRSHKYDHNTAIITGRWASDNPSTIWLNGVDTGFSQDSQFSAFETFSSNRFLVRDGSGFRVANWANANMFGVIQADYGYVIFTGQLHQSPGSPPWCFFDLVWQMVW